MHTHAPHHRGQRRMKAATTLHRPPSILLLFFLLALVGGSRADAFKPQQRGPSASVAKSRRRQCHYHHGMKQTQSRNPPMSPPPLLLMERRGGGGMDRKQGDRRQEEEEEEERSSFIVGSRPPPDMLQPALTGALVLVAAATAFLVLSGGGVDMAWASTGGSNAVARASAIDAAAILRKAGKKAIGGGASGAAASLVQLVTLGWLRTSMNYQYKNGGTLGETIGKLYQEGGVGRFYQGLSVAAVQLPLSRFGDVAANAFVLALLDSLDATRDLPIAVKTVLGSVSAGLWRFLLMPLDSVKTTLQVQGSAKGIEQVKARLREEGVASLYAGAVAQALATAVGHWPYFSTFNYLSSRIPVPPEGQLLQRLGRNAFLGLCSSTVSDCCSNGIRVIKTTKQTSETKISYQEALRLVIEKDGVLGLLGRGLQTRLAVNALQGIVFSIAWRFLEESGVFTFK